MKSCKSQKEQFTDIFFEDSLQSSIKNAKSEILQLLLSLKEKTSVITYSDQVVTATPVDFPRLLTEWNSKTTINHAVRNIIVSALLSAEEKSSGAAYCAAASWTSGFCEQSVVKPSRGTFQQAEQCLTFFGGGGLSKNATIALIKLGGVGCKVDFEESANPVTKIFARSGKGFSGHIDNLFGDKVGRSFDISSCVVIAIQGCVETVSSLHAVIESSATRPVVVLAESFLPDVANTLAEAWKSGKARCLPFVVHKWPDENFLLLENSNLLCVSSDRGDTISNLKLESQRSMDVSVSSDLCVVSNPEENELSKITVEISQSLGGMTGLVKDRTKMLLGFARLCARGGVIRWESLSRESSSFSEVFSSDLVMPCQSLVTGFRASESMKRILQELGCVIVFNQGDKK